jgi:succinate dehydrogenase / fumarate reductase membrane anchor subunit
LTGLFFFSLCLHAWIGVRDVFRDYVFNQTLRGYLQTLVELMLLAYLGWLGLILWGI